jgi:hypothetical protein
MYLGVEPEVEGTRFEIYTAQSEDGRVWRLHSDPILTQSTFPDAVALADGRVRLYLQQRGEIVSAVSLDGLRFTKEAGVRVSKTGWLDAAGVGAATVARLPGGDYLMVFRAAEPGPYRERSINSTTTTLWLARSSDGLEWTRGDMVVESRREPFDGYVDGPELFFQPDGSLELRFWSSGVRGQPATSGQYRMVLSSDGETWSEPEKFSSLLGGDPTYAFIEGRLSMFYTILKQGVYALEFPASGVER